MIFKSSVRARWIRFWMLFSVCVSAFFYSLPVNASISTGTTTTITVTYDKNEEGLWRGNSYLSDELDYFTYSFREGDSYDEDSFNNNYWYLGKRVTLFNSTKDYYGYKISFTLKTNTLTDYDDGFCHRAYWLVGNPTDLYNGQNATANIGSTSFNVWVTTNYAVDTIHLAPFFKFTAYAWYSDGDLVDENSNFYDICNTFTVKYTGYKTVADYTAAMSNIQSELEYQTTELESQTVELQSQTSEMKKQNSKLDNLTSGYDASAGSVVSTQLQGSVDSYGSMEGTLFDSVSSNLTDFQFFDFASVPAMITGLSFITSIMQSWFSAAGGASGVGIVLSVLFSVMLVSMALGLYRLYQSASHRKNRKGG